MTSSAKQNILSDPPQAWLTGFWGWAPERWGCVSFSQAGRLQTILEAAGPGSLWVGYVTTTAPAPDSRGLRGRIAGMFELGLQTGAASEFIDPDLYALTPGRWPYAVEARRAWTFHPEDRLPVGEFAPLTYRTETGTSRGASIAAHGRQLHASEAGRLRQLRAKRVVVYGQDAGPVDASAAWIPLDTLLD